MAKDLDGIKKIDAEEVKKLRKIVLDQIGQSVRIDNTTLINKSKKVDALAMAEKADKEEVKKQADLRQSAFEKRNELLKQTDMARKADLESQKQSIEAQIKENKPMVDPAERSREAAEQARIMAEQTARKKQALSAIMAEEARQKAQKNQASDQSAGLKAPTDIVTEKMMQNSVSIEEEAHTLISPPVQHKIKARKGNKDGIEKDSLKMPQIPGKKEKSVKAPASGLDINKIIRKTRRSVIIGAKNLKYKHKHILRYWLVSTVVAIGFFLLLYAFFYVSVVKYNSDNSLVRKINSYLPLPVFLSRIGYLDYFDYQQIALNYADNTAFHNNLKNILFKNLAYKNLAVTAGFPPTFFAFAPIEQKNIINRMILNDKDINEVPYNRIQKIRSLLDQGRGFGDVKRYGDDYSFEERVISEQALIRFNQDIFSLQTSQISEIIKKDDGYYLVQMLEKAENHILVNYIYIKAKNLDEYLEDEANRSQSWLLL